MVWEIIKDFYNARTTTWFGRASGFLLIVALAVAARFSDNHRNSRRYFVCNTNQPNKSFIEAECFDKYGLEYVYRFPPDAFVGYWLFLVIALSLYTLFALRHVLVVEHHKNDINQMPQNRRRKMEGSCSVFVLYMIQLLLRVATLVVLTCLQLTLRPRSFPSTYKCPLKSPVDCKDDFYKENTSLNWVAIGLNGAIFLSSMIELLHLFTKCCLSRRRYNNLQFICFLLDVDDAEQQEGYDYTELSSKLQRNILASTNTLEEINGKQLKTDTIFTKLLLHKGQIQHSLNFDEREESLLSYTKDATKKSLIEQAYQLFRPDEDTENPKLILLTGRAGIGKTMFSIKLVRDWASGTLFPHEEVDNKYKFVFLFFFRQLNEIDEPLSLLDFLSLSHELDANEFEFVCKNPEQTLIVMDGLDEFRKNVRADKLVPRQDKQSIETICAQILNRSVLNGATVVVTSRPESKQLIKFDRKVEILGFEPKDAEEYFKKFFGSRVDQANLVLGHVKENTNVAGLCYVPVNCFIICMYFQWYLDNRDSRTEEYKFPSTITELYQGILDMFTLKHHKHYKEMKFSDTPDVKPVLHELSKLSFKLLQAKKYVFNQKDLREAMGEDGLTKVIESGIIHSIPGYKTGPFSVETKYCFIHLTFQEFLAALHLVKIKNCYAITQSAIEQDLDVVIQFMSGLLKTASLPDKAYELLSFIVEKLIKSRSPNFLLAIKCIYEFGNSSFAKQVVQQYDFTNLKLQVNDSDCAALAFLLSLDVESKHKTKDLNLSFSSITCVGIRYITDSLKHPNCCIESLNLSRINLGADSAKHISEALSSGHCTLQSLNVMRNNIGADGAKYVSEALSRGHCILQSLNIMGNNMGADGAKYVSEALNSGHCTLQSLDVSRNNIGADGAKYVSKALSCGHCTLQSLDVSRNNIGADGAKYVSEALSSCHCTLQSLNVMGNNIGADGAKYVSEALSSGHCTLQLLDVSRNNIGADGAKYVSEALSSGHCTLQSLNVSDNNIGADGAKYVSEALSSGRCTLQSLDVSRNNIGADGSKYVSEALISGHCTLQSLNVSSNNIGADGAKYVSETLSNGHCTLQSLDVSDNDLGAVGAKYISEVLSSCHCTLQSLNVSYNNIGTDGAKYVSKALSSGHCTLQSLNVSYNNIGADGAKYVSEALSSGHCILQSLNVTRNNIGADGAKFVSETLSSGYCTLQSLNVSNNNIGADGAKYVSEALSSCHCTTLQSLDVSFNNIGADGAKYVSKALSSGHCSLQSLNVSYNNIGADGAKYVSEALSSGHCTLQSLNVMRNNIGADGAKYVSEALSIGHCTL